MSYVQDVRQTTECCVHVHLCQQCVQNTQVHHSRDGQTDASSNWRSKTLTISVTFARQFKNSRIVWRPLPPFLYLFAHLVHLMIDRIVHRRRGRQFASHNTAHQMTHRHNAQHRSALSRTYSQLQNTRAAPIHIDDRQVIVRLSTHDVDRVVTQHGKHRTQLLHAYIDCQVSMERAYARYHARWETSGVTQKTVCKVPSRDLQVRSHLIVLRTLVPLAVEGPVSPRPRYAVWWG